MVIERVCAWGASTHCARQGVELAEARRKAEQMRAEIANGVDPTATRKALDERHRDATKGVGALGSVIAAYYEGPGAHLRTRHEMRVMLDRVFKPHLSSPSLNVRAADLQRTIDATHRNHLRSIPPSISVGGALGGEARSAAEDGATGNTTRPCTATQAYARRGWQAMARAWMDPACARSPLHAADWHEPRGVCGATWREFDLAAGKWIIPAERRKNPRPDGPHAKLSHVVPLSRQRRGLLARVGQGEPSARLCGPAWGEAPELAAMDSGRESANGLQ